VQAAQDAVQVDRLRGGRRIELARGGERIAERRLPFEAKTNRALFESHVLEPAPRPSAIRPEIPAAVDEVIVRALAKDPAARFDSAKRFVEAFREAVSPRPKPRPPWAEWWPWRRA
jgi:serine/threonine protein kinase